MKKIILLLLVFACMHLAQAQLLKKLKEKVDNKVNNTVDKKVDDAVNGKKDDNSNANSGEGSDSKSATGPATLKSYSKYDFVPGEKIIVFEDFMQDAVGDFPAKWNTSASGDIVTIEGMQGHWFRINKQGVFMPDFIDSLPDDYTFEFDLLCDNPGRIWSLYTSIVNLDNRSRPETYANAKNRFTFTVAPGTESSSSVVERKRDDYTEAASNTTTSKFSDKTKFVHVAVWRQKERVRVYFDEEKVWDIPKGLAADAKPNAIVYWLQGPGQDASYFMGNLRLAVGAPDTRKKILEQNKWVTHGILFDVNSDKIKPESYGTIKEMATVLKENPDLKVKIVGHTDADGSDAANLDLSKKRSASVKDFLVKEFGIDASRMETDGKGEGEPIDKNDTPAGKANNRRVEFIKI